MNHQTSYDIPMTPAFLLLKNAPPQVRPLRAFAQPCRVSEVSEAVPGAMSFRRKKGGFPMEKERG